MLRLLAALFDRYAAVHTNAVTAGPPIVTDEGSLVGNVDQVRFRGRSVVVVGWAAASRVTLRAGGARATARPNALRTDVEKLLGIEPWVGFELAMSRTDLPRGRALLLLVTPVGSRDAEDTLAYALPLPHAGWARLALWPGFLWRIARLVPAMLRWRLRQDLVARARIKRGLGLHVLPAATQIDLRALRPVVASKRPSAPIAIVMPVHNAFDLLAEALARVEAHTDLPWHLIAVEDASTDPRVRPFLRAAAARLGDRATLIENDRNLGFIGSANAGLARARGLGRHVVLLNSDALVPPGWASRLMAPILADPSVATVTPMSNDAEIFSVPRICARLPLAPGEAEAMDARARTLDPLGATTPAPTGVGFCMAMGRAWLGRLPALDEAFGRGYGEEVDWCQRARALGARHLGTAALFVEHRGGESFGSEAKRALIARNNALVARRYPAYDGEVQDFIAEDPLLAPRLALGLAWAGARAEGLERPLPIYLAHALGGGAEMDLQRRIREDLEGGLPSVVLRVGGPSRWRIELWGPAGVTSGQTEAWDLVRDLLSPVRRRRLVYSCAVGDPDPAELPGRLLSLAEGEVEARVEVLAHDFFPVSPSYTLLDSQGEFHGAVTPGAPGAADRAHQATRPDGARLDLGAWQDAWRPLLHGAHEVTAFSASSRDLILAAYPAARVAVRPHRMLAEVPRLAPPPEGAPRVVGVLGNIGAQKGAALLRDLAPLLPTPDRAVAGLALIGNIDPAYALPAHVPVHGDYRIAELPALAARYGVTDWLIPSIWPETFSFTTHECLATGLPVHAFAIGAQGDAVAAAPNGVVLPVAAARDARALLAALLASRAPAPLAPAAAGA